MTDPFGKGGGDWDVLKSCGLSLPQRVVLQLALTEKSGQENDLYLLF